MLRNALGLALVLGLAMSGFVVADEPEETCVCPVAAGLEKLPQMSYVVGEKSACCQASAEKMAEKSGEKVQFVVAKKTYSDIESAYNALADETEAFVNAFVTPSSCKVSGITNVAGQTLHCSEKAAALTKAIDEAMNSVAVSYKVGDESCSCPDKASKLAEESGKAKVFVIGKITTKCPVDARIKIAQAKYKAVLQALADMQKSSEDTKTVSLDSDT